MKILTENALRNITSKFNHNDLALQQIIDFEPDCKVYILNDNTDHTFALVCRDYRFDDLDAEKRILQNELGINIVDRIKTSQDYWLASDEFDDFKYIFSLNRIASDK